MVYLIYFLLWCLRDGGVIACHRNDRDCWGPVFGVWLERLSPKVLLPSRYSLVVFHWTSFWWSSQVNWFGLIINWTVMVEDHFWCLAWVFEPQGTLACVRSNHDPTSVNPLLVVLWSGLKLYIGTYHSLSDMSSMQWVHFNDGMLPSH